MFGNLPNNLFKRGGGGVTERTLRKNNKRFRRELCVVSSLLMLCRLNERTLNANLNHYTFISAELLLLWMEVPALATLLQRPHLYVRVIFMPLILLAVHAQHDQSSFLLNTATVAHQWPVRASRSSTQDVDVLRATNNQWLCGESEFAWWFPSWQLLPEGIQYSSQSRWPPWQGLTQSTAALPWDKSILLKLSNCSWNRSPEIHHPKCLPNWIHLPQMGMWASHGGSVRASRHRSETTWPLNLKKTRGCITKTFKLTHPISTVW